MFKRSTICQMLALLYLKYRTNFISQVLFQISVFSSQFFPKLTVPEFIKAVNLVCQDAKAKVRRKLFVFLTTA